MKLVIYIWEKNSYVFNHEHKNDIERYRLIEGVLSINDQRLHENICTIHQSHSIDRVPIDTIIETFKMTEEYLLQNSLKEINSNTFDKVLIKSILKK